MSAKSVAIFGSTGFVGSNTALALESSGHQVRRIRAPRLEPMTARQAATIATVDRAQLDTLVERLSGIDVVVNAAGVPDASSGEGSTLIAGNAAVPALIAAATSMAGVDRLVHVSSAATQGRLPILTETQETAAFSDYSRSKVLGERLVRRFGPGTTVVYRPPGVHGADRQVTQQLARLARSRVASVARPGTDTSPQALIANVAAAIAFLATTPHDPPAIVIHPWEGLTTADVMRALGGHEPVLVPRSVALALVQAANTIGRPSSFVAGNARRLEMLWLGQRQAESWLTVAGWTPPAGPDSWRELGRQLTRQQGNGTLEEDAS